MYVYGFRPRILLFTLLLLFYAASSHGQSITQPFPPLDHASADTLLIKFRPGTPANAQADAHRAANAVVERQLRGSEVLLVRIASNSINGALAAYRNNPNIANAERNYRRRIYLPATHEGSENILNQLTFENFNEQWNLHNTGQEFGLTLNFNGNYLYPSYEGAPDADIDAPEAWDITHGSPSVSIAILDTGVACNHLDLDGKCVTPTVSFVADKSSSAADILGHGSHVAGIAAASTDNGIGIAGVGWDSSIAPLKVCWEDYTYAAQYGVVTGVCDDADVIDALNYAVQEQYPVISMSFAGSQPNSLLEAAIDAAWNSGTLLIGAAGNIYTDDILYPAGYTNVLSVGSSDHQDNLSSFSNHGVAASVLAPGSHIVSTVPGEFCDQDPGVQSDCYDTKSGTSMAAPHVAGLAALMIAHYPSATNAEIRAAIENTAEATGALGQNMLAWSEHGRINMQAALASDPGGSGSDPTSIAVLQAPLLSTVNAGKGAKYGHAEVTIVDDLGNPVANATVDGEFTDPFNEIASINTGVDGVAVFQTSATAKGGVSFNFCVTGVTGALPFTPSNNDCASF